MIDNSAWLAGHAAFERGEECPWGDESARLGWLKARGEQDGWASHDDRGVEFVEPDQPIPAWFIDPVTCGTCHRTWDDGVSTSVTPTPSGRCPFEYDHEEES